MTIQFHQTRTYENYIECTWIYTSKDIQ